MGIYLTLNFTKVAPYERTRVRFNYGWKVLKYFVERGFSPTSTEIWNHANSVSLGGINRRTIECSKNMTIGDIAQKTADEFRNLPFEQQLSSIIIVNGQWDLENRQLICYLSINHDFFWRRLYKDIEFDAYASGDVEDIAELIWRKENLRLQLGRNFVNEITGREEKGAKIESIYFAVGVPSVSNASTLRLAYVQGATDLIESILYTFLKISNEEIRDHSKGTKGDFLISRLMRKEYILKKVHEMERSAGIIEEYAGSRLFIGKDQKSFEKFVNDFGKEVLEPVLRQLPATEDYDSFIDKAFQRFRSL